MCSLSVIAYKLMQRYVLLGNVCIDPSNELIWGPFYWHGSTESMAWISITYIDMREIWLHIHELTTTV